MKKKHTLWVEAYRPTDIEKYISKDEIKTKLKQYFKENDIPHLLLAGGAGTGKTTLAKLIVANLNCDSIVINASDENGIDTIREKVKSFASSASFKPLKVIVLDEADGLTAEAQNSLRNIIEEYSLSTRFILTCNILAKIIEPLQSRFEQGKFKLEPPSKAEIARSIISNILDAEGVAYQLPDIANIINAFYPDIRSMIGRLQRYTVDKVLTYDANDKLSEYNYQVLEILKKPNSSSWNEIRQIIADAQVDDYQQLYRFLFDHLEDFSKGLDADITITLDEYQWRSRIVGDKEINCAACMASLLQLLNAKLLKG